MAMIVGLTWRAGLGDNRDNDPNRRATAVLSARTRALKTGKIVTQAIPIEGEVVIITALPDGRVVGADRLGFDPLSGRHEKQPAPDVDPHFRSFYAVDRANISANTTHAPDEL